MLIFTIGSSFVTPSYGSPTGFAAGTAIPQSNSLVRGRHEETGTSDVAELIDQFAGLAGGGWSLPPFGFGS
jgi:hypothetical protein